MMGIGCGRWLRHTRLAAAALLFVLAPAARAASGCPVPTILAHGHVSVTSQAGTTQFDLEIADSASARAAGLMCRSELAEGHGMLFVYPHPQRVKMWMKNTYVPLDMLFIDADGRIVRILENLEPRQEKRIGSGVPVTAVLELPAGSVARHGIRVGDRTRREK